MTPPPAEPGRPERAERPPAERVRTKLLAGYALWAIVLVGAAVRFATVGLQDLWFDEHITVTMIGQPPPDLLESVQFSTNPPLYYLVADAWGRVVGVGDGPIRALSALLGTATIPVVYAATSTLTSRRAALISAALTAASPLLIWYSQEARNYSLLVLLLSFAFLCFAHSLADGRTRWLWGWAISSSLALTTHYFAIFAIFPQAAWLLLRKREARVEVALALGAVAIAGLALLPLVATQRGGAGWIGALELSERLWQVPQHFVVGLYSPWAPLPAIAVAAVALLALYGAVRVTGRDRFALALSSSIVGLGLSLALLAAAVGEDFILSRNLLVLWVPFAIGLGAFLGSEAVGRAGAAAAAGLCALGLALAIWTAATPEAQRPAYTDLAAELGRPQTEERLIVSQGGFNRSLSRYLEGGRFASDDELSTSELAVVDPRPTESYAIGPCWWVATCGGEDLFPSPRFEPPDEFELEREGSTRLFNYRVYAAPQPVETPALADLHFPPRVFAQSPSP